MRRSFLVCVLSCAAAAAFAQTRKPQLTEGYVVTLEVRTIATSLEPTKNTAEAKAVASTLKAESPFLGRFQLAQDMSRMEVLSTDFVLPAGTLVLHKAGDKFYVIADPKTKTYVPMDAAALLNALEGGAGVVNSEYTAKVAHTSEHKTIAGATCRKSIVTITYVASIPLENDRILVQRKNDIEVWHTPELTSAAALDHFFFRFQQDKTGTCRKVLGEEIGFPMEVNLVITNAGDGKRASVVQAGSLHAVVTDAKVDKRLPVELFQIPPAEYTRVDRSPFAASVR